MKTKIINILFVLVIISTVILVYQSLTEKIEVQKIEKKEDKSISYYIISKGIYKEKKDEKEIIKYHGILKIPKINFERGFLDKDDVNNTIDKNIEYLKESTEIDADKSEIFIAGHSGNGIHSYFNDLDKLKLNDKAIIIYNGKEYNYELDEIKFYEKKESIAFKERDDNTLTLITCSQVRDNKYLVLTFIRTN